ncbi:MAG TPA: LysR family transcriptional regulator, partial [Rhodobacteraceae bacterium]|nr:LysR family transcriptional regulator [Paracoccaceae bacterium]
MGRSSSQAILFELLRSYTVLARTLNLSKAVRELGSTRQTVRRHISLLEERKGEALFRLEERQYFLTEAGKRSLKEAKELLARSEAWLDNNTGQDDGLLHMAFDGDNGEPLYYLQQHSLDKLWQ